MGIPRRLNWDQWGGTEQNEMEQTEMISKCLEHNTCIISAHLSREHCLVSKSTVDWRSDPKTLEKALSQSTAPRCQG
jgi:hypothetical protein